MTAVYAVCTVCLICMISILVWLCAKFCSGSRADRLKFLKNFKRGKCAVIYVIAAPLFALALCYSGKAVGASLLSAIKYSVDLIVLKYDYSPVAALAADNMFFRVTMDLCFALVALNALVFTLTIFGQSASNGMRKHLAVWESKKTYVVVGYNEHNVSILKSIKKSDGTAMLFVSEVTPQINDFAFVHKIALVKLQGGDVGAQLCKTFKQLDPDFSKTRLGKLLGKKRLEKYVGVVVNSDDDSQSLIYVEQIAGCIEKLDLNCFSDDRTKGLDCFVFGQPANESAFTHFSEKTNGCVRFVNAYKLGAMDFVENYPLTRFMDETQIDYESATLRENVDVNVLMIGFGKTNQQIFLTSVANNQFMCKDKDGNLAQKSVHYWIYDKLNAENDKNLNHNYFRFVNETAKDKSLYLPLPQKPADEHFLKLDINDSSFYDTVKEHLTANEGKIAFNYVIIAFGDNVQNLDFAEKISAKVAEWNYGSNTKIFVKIRSGALNKEVVDKEQRIHEFITFGNENKVAYNLHSIVNETSDRMARNRHLSYALSGGMNAAAETAAREKALRKWYVGFKQVQRESNVYACLSIRFKLNLLGFDCCKTSDPRACANDEYEAAYQAGNPIAYDDSKPKVKGRRSVVYCNDMKAEGVRYNLAVQEHQRWNAYMITAGVIPSTLEQLQTEGARNLELRRHSNITTNEGLIEFRKIMAQKQGCSEEETDVIRYDYQLMDDLVWLLGCENYKVVKK